MRREKVECVTRTEILDLIKKKPGIHFRGVCRHMGREIGVIQYHVRLLEKNKHIVAEPDGRFIRYYPGGMGIDVIGKKLLASWARPVEKLLLRTMYSNESISTAHTTLGITTQAVTWHLERMRAAGLIAGIVMLPEVARAINELTRRGILT